MARTCTLRGKTLTLEGPGLKTGDTAPDATLRKSLAETIRISDTKGRTRIISVVPSLDTPVCAMQTKRFNEDIAKLNNVDIITVSCDLPTAQNRFCGAEKINPERMKTLSDYYDHSFGKAWGTLISELRVECRAVFVVDKDNVIRHAEYVGEVAEQPNYDKVIETAKQYS